jgi:NAD(P)-dependent dehydrogenase (short-subunit alcohol dehydrogenase family)
MTGLVQRTALVTGAAGGIGGGIVRALKATGHRIVAVDRVQPSPQDLGEDVERYTCDLADAASIAELTTNLERDGRAIDVLVNCAGINRQKPNGELYRLEEVDNEGWALTLAINLTAPFLLSRALVPGMKERGWGRIVNIASRAGRTYVPASNVDYSASKAGLIGLTRMIAGETAAYGITANSVAPGRISTPLADTQAADVIDASVRAIPVGRVGTSDEVGAAVAYLASDAAGYVTGITIDVNGGAFVP